MLLFNKFEKLRFVLNLLKNFEPNIFNNGQLTEVCLRPSWYEQSTVEESSSICMQRQYKNCDMHSGSRNSKQMFRTRSFKWTQSHFLLSMFLPKNYSEVGEGRNEFFMKYNAWGKGRKCLFLCVDLEQSKGL